MEEVGGKAICFGVGGLSFFLDRYTCSNVFLLNIVLKLLNYFTT